MTVISVIAIALYLFVLVAAILAPLFTPSMGMTRREHTKHMFRCKVKSKRARDKMEKKYDKEMERREQNGTL